MRVAGYLPVYNAEQSLFYTLDYYLNYEHIDAIVIVDCGSFDGTAEIIKAFQDKRVIAISQHIYELHLLPELTTQILQDFFLKRKIEWVLPLHAGEFFHSTTHNRLKAALHNLRQKTLLLPNTILYADAVTFYETELDDASAECFFHKMRYCKKGIDRRPVLYKINTNFDELATSIALQGSYGEQNFNQTLIAPETLACFCYPMPGQKHSVTQTLDAAALMILCSNGKWLEGNDAAPGSLWERYQHIKSDTFKKYYQEQWFFSAAQVAASLEQKVLQYCDALLAYRPQKKLSGKQFS